VSQVMVSADISRPVVAGKRGIGNPVG